MRIQPVITKTVTHTGKCRQLHGCRDSNVYCMCRRWLTFAGSPQPLHAVSHKDDASEFSERLGDVEVAQRAHLEESHA